MEAKKLAAEFETSTDSAVEALIEGHQAERPRDPDEPEDRLLISPFDLRVFAKAIARGLANGIAHRVVDDERCAKCGDEFEPTVVFALSNGNKIHPGCL